MHFGEARPCFRSCDTFFEYYYNENALGSDGAFIKCCGDDDILDISDGVSSDVVNGQGDLDFHDASSAIENKLEGTTVSHDDFKQFYINFEKFMNDKLNKYNAIYNKLDNKIDSSNKMLIEQVNKHVSDGIDSIKTVIAKIEQKIEYNEKIVENAVERIDSIEADVRELINKECNDEIVLNEIKERMQRERNIIFFNIKENASEEEDTKTINNLLSNTHIELSGLQVLRLGKHNPSIIRPLRVRFNSLDDVLWILRNSKKIVMELDTPSPPSIDEAEQRKEERRQIVITPDLPFQKISSLFI
ncbi:hypothetical protein FQA39_LY04459 [Lamprigera yunnana]|nr:hypothetical protein FQA39_LY04459 [Lamprigera yunnana]